MAEPGGGPNGLAMGPDGKLYCCNNGGFGSLEHPAGRPIPHGPPTIFGRANRADRHRQRRGGNALQGWRFGCSCAGPTTSYSMGRAASGSATTARTDHASGISPAFSTPAPMAAISRKWFSEQNPNGIGLSPGGESLYAAETYTCRLTEFVVTAPGKVDETVGLGGPGIPLHRPAGYKFLDSLAVEAGGNICVATMEKAVSGDLPQRRAGRVRSHPRSFHHQHRVRRGRHHGCVYHAFRHRAAGERRAGSGPG